MDGCATAPFAQYSSNVCSICAVIVGTKVGTGRDSDGWGGAMGAVGTTASFVPPPFAPSGVPVAVGTVGTGRIVVGPNLCTYC